MSSEQKTKKDKHPRPVSNWLSIIAGIIAALASIFAGFIGNQLNVRGPAINETRFEKEYAELHSRIQSLSKDIVSVKEQIQNLSNIPEQSKVDAQLKGIDNGLKELQTRHSKLEEVILNNPTKAIEVPLLRKDLDNLKEGQQQALLSLKQGIDQVYDLNKWLLGAMAISIVTLAVSNFLKGREKEKPSS